MNQKLRDPYDLAEEIWQCIMDCQLDSTEAINYLAGMLRDDRELLIRNLINHEERTMH